MTRQTLRERYRNRRPDVLDPAVVPPAVTGVALVTLVLWTVLLRGWLPMPSMPGPMTAPGVPEAMGTANGLGGVLAYLLMWGVMMSAMMYPAMVPLARDYADALDDEPPLDAAGYVAAVFGAYSLVWTATGLVPLVVDALVGLRALASSHGWLLVGVLGLVIAVYQHSDYKLDALGRCCCPDIDIDEVSLAHGLRRGLDHGVNCVRVTWPFFALMVVAGSMNPVVMLGLTTVVAVERLPTWGRDVAAATGITAGVAGTIVLLGTLLA